MLSRYIKFYSVYEEPLLIINRKLCFKANSSTDNENDLWRLPINTAVEPGESGGYDNKTRSLANTTSSLERATHRNRGHTSERRVRLWLCVAEDAKAIRRQWHFRTTKRQTADGVDTTSKTARTEGFAGRRTGRPAGRPCVWAEQTIVRAARPRCATVASGDDDGRRLRRGSAAV